MPEISIKGLIADAIKHARIIHKGEDDGTYEDDIYRNNEDSNHVADAILYALKMAGYSIVKDDGKKAPKDKNAPAISGVKE